jgi:hypothetical protein
LQHLEDPLSKLTRSERRNALIAAAISAVVIHVGVLPTKVTMLGIEFTTPQQNALLVILLVANLYFLLSFLVSAIPDVVRWRKEFQDHQESTERKSHEWSHSDQERYDYERLTMNLPDTQWFYKYSPFVSKARVSFDMWAPVLASVYAIAILACRAVAA